MRAILFLGKKRGYVLFDAFGTIADDRQKSQDICRIHLHYFNFSGSSRRAPWWTVRISAASLRRR